MITDYKITEIFCATDEFSKKFDETQGDRNLVHSAKKAIFCALFCRNIWRKREKYLYLHHET